jgi:hypothetical protein
MIQYFVLFSRMGSDEEDLSSSVDTDSEQEETSASPVETKKSLKTTSPDKQLS